MNSKKFKEQVKNNKKFDRVLIAKNYDSVSFNYRGIGRFHVRFAKRIAGATNLSIYLNGKSLHMATYDNGDNITVKDIIYHLDLNIDNDYNLYQRAKK